MKILVIGGLDLSLVNFRGALLQAMVQQGHEVVAAAPRGPGNVPERLGEWGVRFVPVRLARTGLNPWADALSLFQLRALIRREKPDLVLSYTIKPVIYGSLAAGWAGVPRIYSLITGLGAAFHTSGLKGRIMRSAAMRLYRVALRHCAKIIVQNQEIGELFVQSGIAPAAKIIVVPGSGVDIVQFAASPLPEGPPVFLLLARMLRDKGVEEFVAAARLVRKRLPAARFIMVGDTDPNPAAISAQQLDEWNREGVVEYRSGVADVRPLLSACWIYVLPSYHEGLPRSVLEAMATARPIVTTDTIGCRETIFSAMPVSESEPGVKRGRNGFLVPVRGVEPLANAMEQLANDRPMAIAMGRQSRTIAEQYFSTSTVNEHMLRAMNLSPAP